jgi:hypothetical protein
MNHRGQSSKLAVEIKGRDVHLVVTCASHYDAMMLYDKSTEMLRHGYIKLEFATAGNEHRIEGESK